MRRLTACCLLTLLPACGSEKDAEPSVHPDQGIAFVRDMLATGPVPDAAPPTGPAPDATPGPDTDAAEPFPPDAEPLPDAVRPGPPDGGNADPDARRPPPDEDAGPIEPPPVECAAYADLADEALMQTLHEALHDAYRPVAAEPDQGGTPNRYTTARRRMFLDVEWLDAGGVECLYTGTFFPLEPGEEPLHDTVNTEHVRPRSTLDPDRDSLLFSHQESDLHHLYPSLPGANSTRGSLPFGDPVTVENAEWSPALLGTNDHGERVFAPRAERKGDVARAMFYMTARWGLDLPAHEEEALRRWDAEDPVDAREQARNDAVEAVQGDRNPFVDCPNLDEKVSDFAAFPSIDTNANLPAP